ncbi:MAG TPA: enoyl-CoA hydratase-related protein [Castellaniella sp.]|jgi:enoyl-CoA hydratase/carnithine racemase|nr:enoyl-CoA hydratase-related protein [Castellaniella sp.]
MSGPGTDTGSTDTLVLAEVREGGVMVLTLNRPRKANSLSTELMVELCAHLREADENPDVRCVVLTGSERIFSAGSDISGMVHQGVDWYLDPQRLERWHQIEEFPKPLIAAVNGPAIGGGLELALLCDLVVAGDGASFGQGEITIGVIPGDGGTQRLPRAVGKALSMYMILSGERIPAMRALQAGLVAEVVPAAQVVPRATEIAAIIASRAPLSVQYAKRAAREAFEQPLSQGLAFERQMVTEVFKTADRAEGMQAFLEKRPPEYSGR